MSESTRDFESKLMSIVDETTREAAVEEWSRVQSSSEEPLFNYRRDHVTQVVAAAKWIAAGTGADVTVVTMAAWLHDISKPGLGGPDNHGSASAARAREILASMDVEERTIQRVCSAIERHVGLTLNEPLGDPEAQALWEADKIVKLGVIGFIHYAVNGIRLKPGMTMEDFAKEVREFIPLGEKIAGSIFTEPGKRLACRRLAHIRELSEMLDAELVGGEC